ncbi:hypothetical protein JCM10450v2_008192 [Rhodotorula kratochvilovae]
MTTLSPLASLQSLFSALLPRPTRAPPLSPPLSPALGVAAQGPALYAEQPGAEEQQQAHRDALVRRPPIAPSRRGPPQRASHLLRFERWAHQGAPLLGAARRGDGEEW